MWEVTNFLISTCKLRNKFVLLLSSMSKVKRIVRFRQSNYSFVHKTSSSYEMIVCWDSLFNSKMQRITDIKVTSTPLELSARDFLNNDSGYHSNSSGLNSSSNTTSFNQTRSHSLTPDNFFCIEPIRESDELFRRNRELSSYQCFLDRSLIGRKYVDFFFHLGEKGDYSLIIKKILSFLPDEDLYHAAGVSRTWKNVITSVPAERRRLKQIIKEIKITKENRVVSTPQFSFTNFLRQSLHEVFFQMNKAECELCDIKFESPRSTLMQIQNIRKEFSLSNSPVSSVSPPISYNNNYRFEAYQKVSFKSKGLVI